MIPRYSRPEMAALWSEEAKLNHWLEIEVLACEGMAAIGVIPHDDAQIIRAKAAFDIEKVRENEKRTNHDVIAFLEDVAANVIQKFLCYMIEIGLHAEDVSFGSLDRLSRFEHPHDGIDRARAHVEKQSSLIDWPIN